MKPALFLLTAFLTLSGLARADGSPTATVPASSALTAVHAYPFLHEAGRVGSTDLLSNSTALWNVPAGGLQTGGPSASTLVVVDVEGDHSGSDPKKGSRLEFAARAGARLLLQSRISLTTFFSEHGRIGVPFLVTGTGCEPVVVNAKLVAANGTKLGEMNATIPFKCGE